MSTVQVCSPVIVGRISPASVSIENVSDSVHPRRRRYMIASRAPLPESSASDPSGLKICSRATNPRDPGGERSSSPSEPRPLCGAHMRRTRSGVSSNGRSSRSTIT